MFSDFLSELRRRNVLKAGGAYAAGGWAFFQIADALFLLVGAPDWVSRVLMILLVMGLPFMLAFAWAFELTPEGLKRTEEVDPAQSQTRETGRKIQYLMIGLLSVAVVVLAADRFVGSEPRAGASGAAATAQIAGIPDAPPDHALAVMPFRTSGPETDVWREGMMDMLTTNLDGMGGLQGISTRTVLARLRETGQQNPDLPTTLRAARAAGAAMALVGEVISTGETVRITAAMHDTETGDIQGRLQVEGDADDFLDLVDRLTVQAVEAARSGESGGDALPVPELSALTTESLPALRAYLAGEDLFRQSRIRQAIPQFERAAALDSTFAMAHLRLATAYSWTPPISTTEQQATAGRIRARLRAARRHGDRLPPREAALLESQHAYHIDFAPKRAAEVLRAALQNHPSDPQLWQGLGDRLSNYPTVQHFVGGPTYDEALRRAIALDSSLTVAYQPLASAAISSGDTTEARRLIAAYDRHDGQAGTSEIVESLRASYDLAYGDSTAQARVLERLRAGAYVSEGAGILSALVRDPTAEALRAQERLGQVVLDQAGLYSGLALPLVMSGQYDRARSFVRDTTKTSMSARVSRGWVARALLGRGALRIEDVPGGLAGDLCQMEAQRYYRLLGCYDQARLADERRQANLTSPDNAAALIRQARSVLQKSAVAFREEGEAALQKTAQGFLVQLDGVEALRAGAPEAHDVLDRGHLLLAELNRVGGDWAAMAAQVRALIAGGEPERAQPYTETIATFDPYGHYLAGRTHEAAGDADAARAAYEQFVSARRDADPDIPALQYARGVLDGIASAEAPPL